MFRCFVEPLPRLKQRRNDQQQCLSDMFGLFLNHSFSISLIYLHDKHIKLFTCYRSTKMGRLLGITLSSFCKGQTCIHKNSVDVGLCCKYKIFTELFTIELSYPFVYTDRAHKAQTMSHFLWYRCTYCDISGLYCNDGVYGTDLW